MQHYHDFAPTPKVFWSFETGERMNQSPTGYHFYKKAVAEKARLFCVKTFPVI